MHIRHVIYVDLHIYIYTVYVIYKTYTYIYTHKFFEGKSSPLASDPGNMSWESVTESALIEVVWRSSDGNAMHGDRRPPYEMKSVST